MNKTIALTACAVLFCLQVSAQSATHRLRFKYRLTPHKVSRINSSPSPLRDAGGTVVRICPDTKALKCLITNANGLLTLDPWSVSDTRVNPDIAATDVCYDQAGIVNAVTLYPLTIDLQRGVGRAAGTRVLVGHPTQTRTIHYQTWLIGIYSFGVKIRPRVEDFAGNEYSANAITGTFNAGLSIGYSFGWTTFSHRGASSWSVTPTFSPGFAAASLAKEPLKKQVTTTFSPSNFILSPAVGAIFARNDIGLFFAYGRDYMTGKNSSAWAYQGKRFLGIGLSASFKL